MTVIVVSTNVWLLKDTEIRGNEYTLCAFTKSLSSLLSPPFFRLIFISFLLDPVQSLLLENEGKEK